MSLIDKPGEDERGFSRCIFARSTYFVKQVWFPRELRDHVTCDQVCLEVCTVRGEILKNKGIRISRLCVQGPLLRACTLFDKIQIHSPIHSGISVTKVVQASMTTVKKRTRPRAHLVAKYTRQRKKDANEEGRDEIDLRHSTLALRVLRFECKANGVLTR